MSNRHRHCRGAEASDLQLAFGFIEIVKDLGANTLRPKVLTETFLFANLVMGTGGPGAGLRHAAAMVWGCVSLVSSRRGAVSTKGPGGGPAGWIVSAGHCTSRERVLKYPHSFSDRDYPGTVFQTATARGGGPGRAGRWAGLTGLGWGLGWLRVLIEEVGLSKLLVWLINLQYKAGRHLETFGKVAAAHSP